MLLRGHARSYATVGGEPYDGKLSRTVRRVVRATGFGLGLLPTPTIYWCKLNLIKRGRYCIYYIPIFSYMLGHYVKDLYKLLPLM